MGLKKPLSPEKDQNTEGIQVPVDPTTPESTELAQPKSKKWLTVGLAAVAGLAVVATVFLTYQKLQLKKQSSQPAPTPAATSPTIQPDETADWKTYRNERGGYQYSYPSDWQNDEPCPSFTGPECGDGPQNGSFAHPRNYQYPDGNFWVEYFSNTSCQEIDYLNWPEQWSWEEVDKTEELISGVVATAYEGRIGGIGHTDDQIYDRKYLAMDHQGTCYKIDLASYQNTQHWRLLNQILSTFKFLDQGQADETDNWLTNTNKDGIYTFSYPKEVALTEQDTINLSLWGPTQKEATEFYDGISLSFSLPFKIETASLSTYVDNEMEESEQNADILESKKEIVIGGISGYTYTAQGLGTHKYIYLQSSDKVWVVEIVDSTNDPTIQGYQKTVDKILSTFKFLN